ncbi:hypothetical protein HXX76_009721 [Chlamydomonas incerta]|uniref:SGNH hydrolase-type esterase domain-containing protein n=1 Tax=Chlamydomonas incerta TaxID=51695 RepID=A0A835SWH4_CHLIN|nr:hypothetical protein HXX76_009721 [Chlamydomonas incerta]|eukprot:KAG2431193.1 hypothetical protein HXX76_009721 [Chlamydomonas incerta]
MGMNYKERTKERPEMQWDWGHAFSGIEVNKQPASQVLGPVLAAHRFTLPVTQLARAVSYGGSGTRLRHVVGRLLAGREVRVGVVGGSISWGHGSGNRGETDWFSIFSKWLIEAFPRSNVTTRNGCVPGITSQYMIMCLEQSLDAGVELVFVEFNLNDGQDGNLYNNRPVKDTERLVRRLLALPSRPAVVLLHSPQHGMASYPQGHPKNPDNDLYVPFYNTPEDAYGAVSQYYDVPGLSMRTALYRLAVHLQREGFLWEQTFQDIHPGVHGHRCVADLPIYLLQQVALGLLLRPFSPEDEEVLREGLPPPMYEGNDPPDAPMCVLYDNFKALALSATGFEYRDEGKPGKPKPGFIATTPGSRLLVRVNTDRTSPRRRPPPPAGSATEAAAAGLVAAAAAAAGAAVQLGAEPVRVFFFVLRSYQHMGMAAISCVSGCTCHPLTVDGNNDRRASQLHLIPLSVSQAAACDIAIEVLNTTHSGEHKMKVAGVVVAERAGAESYLDSLVGPGGGEFGVKEHSGLRQAVTWTKEGRKGGPEVKGEWRRR